VTLHLVLQALQARGHTCSVIVETADTDDVVDGIAVFGRAALHDAQRSVPADVVLAQLDAWWTGMKLAARRRRPFVYYMHIGGTPRSHLVGVPDLTLFSSRFVQRRHDWLAPSLVVHPPIVAADYATEPGGAITLVNLTEEKGADVFWALTERLPDHEFLGVRGGGPQLEPVTVPPNVEIVGPVDDMRTVYARTRVLLAPSVYESFGRVPLEAAVSGIPTIAHPAEGLREALGDAPLWVDRDDVDAWVDAVRSLDDPECFRTRASAARAQVARDDSAAELDALDRALRTLVQGSK
jgi:glycosyltransferase involved in cell wall biosynthesis